jgi:hypothetical protein
LTPVKQIMHTVYRIVLCEFEGVQSWLTRSLIVGDVKWDVPVMVGSIFSLMHTSCRPKTRTISDYVLCKHRNSSPVGRYSILNLISLARVVQQRSWPRLLNPGHPASETQSEDDFGEPPMWWPKGSIIHRMPRFEAFHPSSHVPRAGT